MSGSRSATTKAVVVAHKASQRLGRLQTQLRHHRRDLAKNKAAFERSQETVRNLEVEIVKLCPHNLVWDGAQRSGFRLIKCTNCTLITWEAGTVAVQKQKAPS